jgi:hypothetical protein
MSGYHWQQRRDTDANCLVKTDLWDGEVIWSIDMGTFGTVARGYVGMGGVLYPIGGGGAAANPTGTVGLAAVNGVATTVMRSDAAPPLSQAITPTWTGLHTYLMTALGTTLTDATWLKNTTAATAGAPLQYSPSLRFTCHLWNFGGLSDYLSEWRVQAIPTGGALLSKLSFQRSNNGGAWAEEFSVDTTGVGTFANTLSASNLSGTNTGDQTVPAQASKSDQTTGTSLTVYVQPGVQQYHDSAAKAWMEFNASTDVVNASYGCTYTDNGTGDYTFNFFTSFTTAFYSISFLSANGSEGITSLASGSARVFVQTLGGVSADPAIACFAAHGRQ